MPGWIETNLGVEKPVSVGFVGGMFSDSLRPFMVKFVKTDLTGTCLEDGKHLMEVVYCISFCRVFTRLPGF